MKNDKELYDDEIEEKKRAVVYVLKYLASVYSDFRYDDDTILIWMNSLKKCPKEILKSSVEEWCNLNPRKPVLSEFRTLATSKMPYNELNNEREIRLYRDENGYDYAEIPK